jgi:hypothetical protein
MLFSVPVPFNLTATRKGGERKQSTQSWSIVEFEMQDQPDGDVPVVLRWKPTFPGIEIANSSAKNAIGPSPLDKQMHVRKIGENFFIPVMRDPEVNAIRVSQHGEGADFLTGESVANMLLRFEDVGVFATLLPGETFQRRLRKNGGDGLADFDNIEQNDLDRKVASIRDRLRNFLLVDGIFYERCKEPEVVVFTTEVDIDGQKQTGAFALVTTDPHMLMQVDKRAEVFQLEDYRSAFAKAQRSNSSREKKDILNLANEYMQPEIDQLESIYASDAAWMRQANRIALNVTSWIALQTIGSVTEDLIYAFKRLHKSIHVNEDEGRFDVMSEGFSMIVAACSDDSATEHLAKQAVIALAILDDRPVSVAVNNARPAGL